MTATSAKGLWLLVLIYCDPECLPERATILLERHSAHACWEAQVNESRNVLRAVINNQSPPVFILGCRLL